MHLYAHRLSIHNHLVSSLRSSPMCAIVRFNFAVKLTGSKVMLNVIQMARYYEMYQNTQPHNDQVTQGEVHIHSELLSIKMYAYTCMYVQVSVYPHICYIQENYMYGEMFCHKIFIVEV